MIAVEIVAEVRRLLEETPLSHRKIARLAGVSRGLVDAVASGKRPDYEIAPPSDEDMEEEPSGPPSRCPSCGGMVYLPCRLCRTRSRHFGEPSLRSTRPTFVKPTSFGPIGLDLRPEHQARYEQIRRWREDGISAPCI